MILLHDYQGVPVRFTTERQAHILAHPEMAGMEQAIAVTVRLHHHAQRPRDSNVRSWRNLAAVHVSRRASPRHQTLHRPP